MRAAVLRALLVQLNLTLHTIDLRPSKIGNLGTPLASAASRLSYKADVRAPVALAHLRAKRVWVAWDYWWNAKRKRWTKPPFNPHTGRKASIRNPQEWGTFDEAVVAVAKFSIAGIGLVLTKDGGIGGVDSDHCISDSGSLSPLAAEIIEYAETYAEESPRGQGLPAFLSDKILKAVKNDGVGVEIYGHGRFLTVTGRHIDGTPSEIRRAPRTLAKLTAVVEAAGEDKRAKERGMPNGHTHGGGGNGNFFKNVNDAALANLDGWVPTLHPTARKFPNGAWRIPPADLGRPDLEEDLSYHPSGISYFSEEYELTPIDAVLRFGKHVAGNPAEGGLWLCERIGIDPEVLGCRVKDRARANGSAKQPEMSEDPNHWPDPAPLPESLLPVAQFYYEKNPVARQAARVGQGCLRAHAVSAGLRCCQRDGGDEHADRPQGRGAPQAERQLDGDLQPLGAADRPARCGEDPAPDAYQVFIGWLTELERRIREDDLHPALESHFVKYKKLVPALALICHLADGGKNDVTKLAAERALMWVDYLETHARRAFASITVASTDAAMAIIAKVKSGHLKRQFSSREVWRPGWSRLTDSGIVNAALKLLVDYDWLAVATVETFGRTATVYIVNPKVLATQKQQCLQRVTAITAKSPALF
jgi:Protein of unknown function (DUF3987)